MPNFIPYTSFLSDIYIPFHEKPKKNILSASNFDIESDSNGSMSIINLSSGTKKYIPFIDISKYDFDRKDWFYYNVNGFPYRLNYTSSDTDYWTLESLYNIDNFVSRTETLTVPYLFDRDITRELGIYISLQDLSVTESVSTNNFYKGAPLLVAIENDPLNDITNYGNINSKPTLNRINTSINKEFYYDFDQNRIITNQNLASFNPDDITIAFYTTIDKINIKCRLAANDISASNTTPVVDYYIAKLSGQNLRG